MFISGRAMGIIKKKKKKKAKQKCMDSGTNPRVRPKSNIHFVFVSSNLFSFTASLQRQQRSSSYSSPKKRSGGGRGGGGEAGGRVMY